VVSGGQGEEARDSGFSCTGWRRAGLLRTICALSAGSPRFPPMSKTDSPVEKVLEKTIFASRWLQAPLYVGLIVAQCVYVYQFMVELVHLVHLPFAAQPVTAAGEAVSQISTDSKVSTDIMLMVLGLIDVVMIANLLIMVIIGGYETFVSRLHLDDHADQPEWLSHVNAGALKVKLATALISISSIHLLATFIKVRDPLFIFTDNRILWQVIIHLVFVFSAIALAWADRIMMANAHAEEDKAAH
jgi:uncharacterized protein (TIGR00645 family)